jgi:hypothetical protein
MADGLSDLDQDLLTGSYDCVDRIILNAYFRMGHSPGGFHVWWQALTGSDDTLDNTHLMRMSGRFSRRLRGYAKAHDIPVIDCSVGERKHDIAEEYLAKTKITEGCFSFSWVAPKPGMGRHPGPDLVPGTQSRDPLYKGRKLFYSYL